MYVTRVPCIKALSTILIVIGLTGPPRSRPLFLSFYHTSQLVAMLLQIVSRFSYRLHRIILHLALGPPNNIPGDNFPTAFLVVGNKKLFINQYCLQILQQNQTQSMPIS